MIISSDTAAKEQIELIQCMFSKAEQYLKEDELIDCGLLVPAVNQLRYVGEHLLRSLVSEEEAKVKDGLDAALKHCERAIFDALEVKIQFYMSECLDFRKAYQDIEIIPVINSYIQDDIVIQKICSAIPKLRRTDCGREQVWQKLEESANELHGIHCKWLNARPELNKSLHKERQKTRRFWLQISVAVISIIAAIIVGILK